MALTRREFGRLGLGSMAGLALAPLLGPARTASAMWQQTAGRTRFFDVHQARVEDDAVWAIMIEGEGGNSMLVRGGSEAMLVDTKNCGFGRTLRREAFNAAGLDMRYVVNTHHHGDHVGGNPAFTPDTEVYAHANAVPRITGQAERLVSGVRRSLWQLEGDERGATAPGQRAVEDLREFMDALDSVKPEHFAPNKAVPAGRERFGGRLGVVEFEVHHFGPGHTDNDLVVRVPRLNLVHTGDLLFNRRHPFIDRPAGATTVGWQGALRRVLDLCDDETVVIPGHGPITSKAGVQEQIEYFDTLRRIVRHAKDVDGMTREEAVKIQSGAFPGYEFQQLWERAVGAMYDELAEGE